MHRFADLFKRFRRDERGVFLVFFALIAIVLIAASGAVVDFTRVQQARTRAQIAFDAAALALQSKIGTRTATELQGEAQLLLTERIADSTVTAVVESATPDTKVGRLTISGYISVPTYFVQLVGIKDIRSSMLSEVTRASSDIEVAVAADITYSMLGSKLTALKDALKSTINLLVQTTQTPTYSKMAIAPYSNGVNIGPYANNSRGAIVDGKSISSIQWSAGVSKNITAISNAEPGQITISDNTSSFPNDTWVYISGVKGMTEINGQVGQVANVSSPTSSTRRFNLKVGSGNLCTTTGRRSCGYSEYTSSGTITKCLQPGCLELVTTSSAHGIPTGKYVYITGATGTTGISNNVWKTTLVTATSYVLEASGPGNGSGTTGTSYCVEYGCTYYLFNNNSSGTSLFMATECAVERTSTTFASLDTAPSTAPVGIQYAPTNGIYPGSINLEACPNAAIQPLTSSKSTLETLVNSFQAQGSTAGHIGLAWAWYMLSPTFISGPLGTQWPTDSVPAAYKKPNLVKAIILMTDGEFNTMYTYGAPSKDADIVSNSSKSNTNAPLGTSLAQGAALCTEIKKSTYGILLYTVGFNITKNSAADKFLSGCATNTDMYKTASDAATLKKAFEDIANSLSELRISK